MPDWDVEDMYTHDIISLTDNQDVFDDVIKKYKKGTLNFDD